MTSCGYANHFVGAGLLAMLIAGPSSAKPDRIGASFANTTRAVEQSIQVVRLRDGKVLYEHQPQQVLVPASTMKVLTAAAALERFGAYHQFKTEFLHTGTLVRGRLQGDLYVVGGGDPMFVSENMWQVASDLKNRGIDEITGDLVIDNRLFSGPRRDASRQEGAQQSRNAYDAPVTAFAINFNTLPIVVAPADRVGQKAQVGFDPYWIQGIAIDNRVRTVGGGVQSAVQATRVRRDGKTTIVLRGSIALGGPLQKIYRSVVDPVQVSGEIVRSFLQNAGIRVLGRVREGAVPNRRRLLLSHSGKSVAEIVRGLNYYSNNYIADVLLHHLGSSPVRKPGPATLRRGADALQSYLTGIATSSGGARVVNGSGLSTGNRISAAQLVAVLTHMHKRADLFPEFLASFPASGKTGSLARRFRGRGVRHLQGFVRAKTGRLTQPVRVSSLTGYLTSPVHGLCAFAVIQNGKKGASQPPMADLQRGQEQGLASLFREL